MTRPEIPFEVDHVFLKYALGMGNIDPTMFDPVTVAGAYYDVFKAMPDSELVTKQLMKTIVLAQLQLRSNCFTTQSMQLVVFGIAASLQEGIGEKIKEIEPELEQILPDVVADKVKEKAPVLLGELLIKSTMVTFLPKLLPEEIFGLGSVIKNGLENAKTPEEFTKLIEDYITTTPIPKCPDLFRVAKILREELPKLNEAFSSEILPIIAKLRSLLKTKGIAVENLRGVEELFKTMKPIVAQVVTEARDLTKGAENEIVDNLKKFLKDIVGLDTPADLSSPMLPTDPVQAKTAQIFAALTSTPGPLKEFLAEIVGEKTK